MCDKKHRACPTRESFGDLWMRKGSDQSYLITYGTGYWDQLTYEPVGGGELKWVEDDGEWDKVCQIEEM